VQLKSIASRAQCAWFEEQRVPRRRCCEPSGWGIDRPEGAAPGFLLPVILVPTALNVSCDDEDAVWPPEPREEAGLATDAHLFKEAFKESFRVTRRTISHYLSRFGDARGYLNRPENPSFTAPEYCHSSQEHSE
jgi:hypothetical protein